MCCFFFISPSGETPGEIHDFHTVSRGFYLHFLLAGRVGAVRRVALDGMLAGGRKIGPVSLHGRGHRPVVIPLTGSSRHSRGGGRFAVLGFPLDDDLQMNP